jgi:hypothetical protein
MSITPYLKNAWMKKDADGIYYLFFKVGGEQWMLNLSVLNPDELLSTEGPTLIQQKLDEWLAEQDSPN